MKYIDSACINHNKLVLCLYIKLCTGGGGGTGKGKENGRLRINNIHETESETQ